MFCEFYFFPVAEVYLGGIPHVPSTWVFLEALSHKYIFLSDLPWMYFKSRIITVRFFFI